MRIVEPTQEQTTEDSKMRSKKSFVILVVFALLAGGAAMYVLFSGSSDTSETTASVVVQQEQQPLNNEIEDVTVEKTGELRIFTDNEFNVFYNNLLQPDLERVENPPPITGNDTADTRIRSIAESRGYRLRSSPSADAVLVSVDGYQLHSVVSQPWEDMQQAAANEGLSMDIVSGYRSVSDQRSIFTSRLANAGASVDQVATGNADDIVDQVLVESSIPGYSKHHTAYTIDLRCEGFVFENFKNSPCFTWLSSNNYENAKEFGFIPSYPPEADAQGPDPEAWEYVYVGKDPLLQ